MKFEKFAKEVQEQIKDYLPEEYKDAEVLLHPVLKNNATQKMGLSILNDQDFAPVYYLDDYYKEMINGRAIQDVLKEISNLHMQSDKNNPPDLVKYIKSFESAKDYLKLFLINADKNQELLSSIPYEQIEDFAVACQFYFPGEGEHYHCRTIVNDALMKKWGLNAEELFDLARKNTVEKHPFLLYSMEEMLFNISGKKEAKNLLKEIPTSPMDEMMYVLTNEELSYGAAAILYPSVMEQLNKILPDGYYILPSSIHEMILVDKRSDTPISELEEMVREINATQVEPHEILSDHVYCYDSKTQQIKRLM